MTNTLPPDGLDLSVPLGTSQNQCFGARLAPLTGELPL
jgi:hypothetical protein